MSIEFLAPEVDELTPRIAVIGVGGAGGNAIANMMRADVQGVDFLVANTDAQALKQSTAPHADPARHQDHAGAGRGQRGRRSAAPPPRRRSTSSPSCSRARTWCFIAAGMGGGTGTGAAPVIAKAARDMGILTVGVVTKPFAFEGNRRAKAADQGIEELQKYVDTLIVIPNQNLFLIANANTTFKEAFEMADEVLQQGVRGITDLMVMPGLINLDFADVRSVMQEMGKAMMGTGEAAGDNRALEAAQKAIANPLLDGVSMQGAKGVIISITGGDDMRLLEVDEAANHIRDLVDPDANIIWGSAFNPDLEGRIRVSVVATGIEAQDRPAMPAQAEKAEPTRAFSFGGARREEPAAPAAQPVAAEPVAAPAPAPAPSYAPAPAAEVSPPPAAPAADEDELVLGAEIGRHPAVTRLLARSGADAADDRARGAARRAGPGRARPRARGGRGWPAAPLARTGHRGDPRRRRAAPRVKLGGTLFERMSNAARGDAARRGHVGRYRAARHPALPAPAEQPVGAGPPGSVRPERSCRDPDRRERVRDADHPLRSS